MLDYLFFADEPCRQFVGWLAARNIPVTVRQGEEEKTVSIPEDLEETMLEDIDEFYERMLALNEALVNEGEGSEHASGITLSLADGQSIQAPVPPELLNRLLSALSPKELGEFVQRIVDAVEHPDSRPFCQQARDAD